MKMHLIALVLMSLTSQLALGNPFIFPDKVNVDSEGVWRLKNNESIAGANVSSLGITNTSAKDKLMLHSENEIDSEVIDQGKDHHGNKQINKTDLICYVNPEDGADTTLLKSVNRRATGKQIFFPVHSNPIGGSGNNQNSPMIGPCRDGYIHYQGKCSQLLSSRPCTENWWLVMKGHDFAECEPRPCLLGQIFYQNICVYPEDSNICAEDQILYVELTGEAFCDCESDYFYNIIDGTCVPEYTQGWCNWGQYIVQNGDGIPECVQNPCGRDIYVYHEQHDWCYKKSFVGFCEQKQIEINENEVAGCKDVVLDLRNIFEVPTLRRCPRGLRRDILHECRRRFSVPSIASVLNSKNRLGRCPTGWTKGPRGCKKIRNLFSG